MADTGETTEQSPIGSIGWQDLTVRNADLVRDFYARVIGWQAAPVEMSGYSDYVMMPPGLSQPVAGICHARGQNADLPPQWLIYIVVEDVARSAAECLAHGGAVLTDPRPAG